jgi:hypothetical protein
MSMSKPLPSKPGLYIGKTGNPLLSILEWTGEYWCYPGNYIDIAQKYDDVVTEWQEMPEIKPRWETEPVDGALCVVKLVGSKNEDHGYAIASYDASAMSFIFSPVYDGWTPDYDDWQFVGFAEVA